MLSNANGSTVETMRRTACSSFLGQETPAFRHGEEWPSPFCTGPPCGGVPADHNGLTLVPLRASGCPGKLPLDKDRRRYCLLGTVSNPVRLVNPRVTEQWAEVPPTGVNFNAPAYRSPVASCLALAESGQVQACSE